MSIGNTAPEFALLAHDGSQVSLSSFRGQKNVLLVFYVKDNTPG